MQLTMKLKIRTHVEKEEADEEEEQTTPTHIANVSALKKKRIVNCM